ncbi:MAG: glycosyltransferase [Ardenticatenaceae bacterium]|nr:glycosyltransferase [Ardenticatenaceae bacterium]
MRIALVGERLAPPFDEGIKNTTSRLIAALRRQHEVLAVTRGGTEVPALGLRTVRADRFFRGGEVERLLAAFEPEVVLYVPTACATVGAFVRARRLAQVTGQPVLLLALQPRRYGPLARRLLRHLQPTGVLAATPGMAEALKALGVRAQFLPATGVDLGTFHPVAPGRRAELRAHYELPVTRRIVLHVGHIKTKRNLDWVRTLEDPETHVVVVGSSSTGQERALIARLRAGGVSVMTDYLPRLVELYQLADVYAFPVTEATGAVALPLSVLEALACDLPVVSTPYGALPEFFSASPSFRYVQSAAEMASALPALASPAGRHRALAEAHGWPAVATRVVAVLAEFHVRMAGAPAHPVASPGSRGSL